MLLHRRLSLRSFLTFALLAVLLPIVLASGNFFYRSAHAAMEEYALQLSGEAAARTREKVDAFFDAPQRVIAFNLEQARVGQLMYRQPDVLMRQFALQIEQRPQLTFVSMGLPDGQYYAGGRSPRGKDQALHTLSSRISNGRAMEVMRIDPDTRKAVRVSLTDFGFDARDRPWYRAALERTGMAWYAPYRYSGFGKQTIQSTVGMGVSAPLRASDGSLIGVLAADVAMSKLNDFLAELASEWGGKAFLVEATGEMLASSSSDDAGFGRTESFNPDKVHMDQSLDPVIRALGLHIRATEQPEGSQFMEVDGVRHLARWWSHALNNGPVLTMAIILPESRFNTPLRDVLHNTVITTIAVMLASVFFAIFVAHRVAWPMRALSDWAARLAQADWHAQAPKLSPIRELRALEETMGTMANQLKSHAEGLEDMVAERTAELEDAVAAIEQTLTDQRQFIAMMSHEVRSPLAVINAAGQLLALRSKDLPPQQALAQRILRGSARLSTFFDNCLTEDRIESRNFALEPEPVDVAELAQWVTENGGQLSGEHPIELDVADGLPPVQGDPVLLRVMLVNVLSNAFKYSAPGTPVSMQVTRHATGCRFTIEDEGPGIPLEEQAVVFEKYRRGRGAEGIPGAGLGLALVKRIVDLHGGRVSLEPRVPSGTRFHLDIPFIAPEAAGDQAHLTPADHAP